MSSIRRALAALLLLAFALGQPMPVAQAGGMPMATAGGEAGMATMPGGCGGHCGDTETMPAAACGVLCAGSAAIIGSPIPTPTADSAAVPSPVAERTIIAPGWAPDPYPPRSSILA